MATQKSDRIVIPGGNRGIGGAIAADLGERAVVWSRSTNGLDAADGASVAAVSEEELKRYGAPWGLVHTVGAFDEVPLLESSEAFYREMLDSNLTSAFLVTKALVPAMIEAGRGRVILFAAAGVGSQRAMRRAPVYFAVKEALVAMARTLAAETAPHGVTVNVISPGIIRHPDSHAASQDRMRHKVPAGSEGTPEDLLGPVRWLLSEESGYTTGQVIAVDGGLGL